MGLQMCHHPQVVQGCARESRGRIGAMERKTSHSESQAYFLPLESKKLHCNMHNGG
jgi:hypothetical protein